MRRAGHAAWRADHRNSRAAAEAGSTPFAALERCVYIMSYMFRPHNGVEKNNRCFGIVVKARKLLRGGASPDIISRLVADHLTRRRVSRTSSLIGVFGEDRHHAAVPRAVEFLQQFLGRRDAARDEFLQRPQVARFVVAVGVEPGAARKPLAGEPQASRWRDRARSGRGSPP